MTPGQMEGTFEMTIEEMCEALARKWVHPGRVPFLVADMKGIVAAAEAKGREQAAKKFESIMEHAPAGMKMEDYDVAGAIRSLGVKEKG